MGQGSSSDGGLNSDFDYIHSKLAAQLKVMNSLAFLKHSELISIVEELNTIMKDFVDRNGKQLCFSIRKGSDSTIFWKPTIRIRCIKLNTLTNSIESSRLLTLRQFIILYKEIKDQMALLLAGDERVQVAATATDQSDVSKEDAFSTSNIFSSADMCEGETECCVCMDRRACIMLSCCHEFCEICIDSWTKDQNRSTCPLCRSKVKSTDDAWVMPDKNESENFDNEVKGYLTSLADRGDD